jgi:hypothetical protein
VARSHAVLAGLFDYAGLFPPAHLPLASVVERYAAYRRGPDSWMLGRLVVPIDQLVAVEDAATALPDEARGFPWGLSVLGSGSVEDDRPTLADFTARQQRTDERLRITSVEVRVGSPLEARRVRALAADGWDVYCEPVAAGDAVLDAIAIAGMRAKLRAGGVRADQIPSAEAVARLLAGCVQRGISMKATAGLQHAVSGSYPLSDEPGSPCAGMHGYLNLLVAAGVAEAAGAAAVRAPEVVDAIARILQLTRTPMFTAGGVLEWVDGNGPLTEGPLHEIAPGARALVRGIGSCSFEDPVADARALGLG